MDKKYRRWPWLLVILLVPGLVLTFRPAIGRAQEPPGAEAPGKDQNPSNTPEGLTKAFEGTVAEVIDAGRHIYVRVDTGTRDVWVAVPSFLGEAGDKVLVPPGLPVADYHSRMLDRTFKMIIFVSAIQPL